jgi:hypothetical protein
MLAMITGRRIWPSYGASKGAASIRDALRALRQVGLDATAGTAPLETLARGDEPPRLEPATPLEGSAVTVRAVPGPPVAGFAAFLDGIQRSQVIAHAGTVPIVHGAIAAAVRRREGRRLRTWAEPIVAEALYAPIDALPPALAEALRARCPVVDPMTGDAAGGTACHPQEFTARALTAVQRAREEAERELLDHWVTEESAPLLVDGGISGSAAAARSPWAVGVVKSHRTLYVGGDTMGLVLGLREGERTTAVGLSSPRRSPVASWYLRLRDATGRSPLFGLVRVEIARPDDARALEERADHASRWLLAERAPVALPDQRWDVMVYGVRECEQYLSSILR